MDEKQWLLKLATNKNLTRKISIITRVSSTTTLSPLNFSRSDEAFDDQNDEFLTSLSLLMLIILYGIVVFSGVCGNSTLLISLCSQSTTRVKNPLLLALCAADLLVSLVSAPLTIVGVLLRHSRTLSFSMANVGCKVFHYMQVRWRKFCIVFSNRNPHNCGIQGDTTPSLQIVTVLLALISTEMLNDTITHTLPQILMER